MTMLLQWLWQGSAIVFMLWVALRCAPRINAATRYALWWVALFVVLLLPFVTYLPSLGSGSMTLASVRPGSVVPDAREFGPMVELPVPPDWLIACGIGAWLGSVLLGFGRLGRGLITVRQLKQRSRRVAISVERSLSLRQQWRRAGRRQAALRVSSSVSGACALGLLGRPVIVLSDRLVTTLDSDDLDLIVLHEQVHLARYDDWATLLQSFVRVFVGWHPAVRVVTAELDAEREAACDDTVAARIGNAARYATCLADAADVIARRHLSPGQAMAPHAAGTGSLLGRVQRLLDPRVRRRAALQRFALGSGVAGLALSSVVAIAVGPIVGAKAPREPLPWRAATRTAATPTDGREAMHSERVELSAPSAQAIVVDQRDHRPPRTATGAASRRAGDSARVAGPMVPFIEPLSSPIVTASAPPVRAEHVAATSAASEPALPPIEARVLAGTRVALIDFETSVAAGALSSAAPDGEPTQWADVGRQVARDSATVGRQLARRSTTFGRQVARRSSALGGFFGRAGKAVAEQF